MECVRKRKNGREGAVYEGFEQSAEGTGDDHLIDHHTMVQSNRRETRTC
jgi:hypothetical protein